MTLITYGINHKTAPVNIREQLAFNASNMPHALQQLLQRTAVNEAVILSTCNRTEIYSHTSDITALKDWLHTHHQTDLSPFCYHHQGIDAVRHLMRVASGLDSMVLGEPEILGQIKSAYEIACSVGSVGQQLQQLFPAVFSASKHVRTTTEIGKSAVSMAYAVTQLAKRIFSNLKECSVLFIGAGETIELVATHFDSEGMGRAIFANRTIERAHLLAEPLHGHAIRIGDIPNYLSDIDIIISATASQLPIIGKGMIETALKHKKRRAVFMADLAVPRDIEPEVGQLEDVYLYNIDDLQQIIDQNRQSRQSAAAEAEALIDLQAQHYMRQLRILDASDMITRYRQQLEKVRDDELDKALRQLIQGKNPQAVLKTLAYNITNKAMHKPTLKIREAAYDEKIETLMLLKDVFDL